MIKESNIGSKFNPQNIKNLVNLIYFANISPSSTNNKRGAEGALNKTQTLPFSPSLIFHPPIPLSLLCPRL